MKQSSKQHYERQLWQLSEWDDLLYIMDASKALVDYAKYVEPLHLELTTIAGNREFILDPTSITSEQLSANLSAALKETNNTGLLKIDYLDTSRGYKDDFLPVELKIQQGSIAFTTTMSSPTAAATKVRDTDHLLTGGLIRAFDQLPVERPSTPPVFPEIFTRLARAVGSAPARRAPI